VTTNDGTNIHPSTFIYLSIAMQFHTLVTNATTLDGLHVEHGDRPLFLKSFNSPIGALNFSHLYQKKKKYLL
jgi:hypothetical protein